MSDKKAPQADTKTIEKTANDLADYMYGILHELPDDEKWASALKIRNSANELLFYVAQAAGSVAPSGSEYEWSAAHKNANALKTMYIFAARQKFIDLEPGLVVKLDNLMAQLKDQSKKASEMAKTENEKELDHWRKKYKIWKEINQ